MIANTYKEFEILAAGGTDNITLNEAHAVYFLTTSGAVTLVANYAIDPSGEAKKGMRAEFYYDGNLNFNSNTMTILDLSVPSDLEAKQWKIEAIYNGTSWDTHLYLDFEEMSIVDGDRIVDDTVTSSKVVSLDGAKIDNDSITADAFDETSTWAVRYAKVTIPNANVLNSNTTPYTLLSASASVIYGIVWAAVLINGHTTPYATNTIIEIKSGIGAGTVEPICELDCLATPAGTNPMFQLPFIAPTTGATVYHLVQNQDVVFSVQGGDPTAGDGDIVVLLAYIEII